MRTTVFFLTVSILLSSSLLRPAALHWQSDRNCVFQHRPRNIVQETEASWDSSEAEAEVCGVRCEVTVCVNVLLQEGVCEGWGGPEV